MFQQKLRIFVWRQNDGCSIATACDPPDFPMTPLHFEDPLVFRKKSKHHCSFLGVQLPWWGWDPTCPCTLRDVVHPCVSAPEGKERSSMKHSSFTTAFQISNGLTFSQLIHPFNIYEKFSVECSLMDFYLWWNFSMKKLRTSALVSTSTTKKLRSFLNWKHQCKMNYRVAPMASVKTTIFLAFRAKILCSEPSQHPAGMGLAGGEQGVWGERSTRCGRSLAV